MSNLLTIELLAAQNQWAQAMEAIQQLPAGERESAEILRIMAYIAHKQEDNVQADEYYYRAHSLNPNIHIINFEWGMIKMILNQPHQALKLFYQAYQTLPQDEQTLFNLMRCCSVIGGADMQSNFKKLLPIYKKYLGAEMEKAILISVYAERLELFALAESMIQQILKKFGPTTKILSRLARYYFDRGQHEQACAVYGQFIDRPDCPASAMHEFAFAEELLSRVKPAGEHYQRALVMDAQDDILRYNYAQFAINQKQYHRGFSFYEARWNTPLFTHRIRHLPAPNWQGEDLSGKTLFIYGEQAVGDHIMFGGLFDLLPKNCRIKISVDRRLEQLFIRNQYENIEVIIGALNDEANHWHNIQADYVCAIATLPLILGFPEKYPDYKIRQMSAEPTRIAQMGQFLANRDPQRFLVGFSFACRSVQSDSKGRSTELSDWLPFFNNKKLQFVNVQYNSNIDEIDQFNQKHGTDILCHPTLDCYEDIEGVLAILHHCHLVVSVANTTVHLAAALHLPTLVAVMTPNSWRWGHSGATMPWYHSVYISRQIIPGIWHHPIAKMHDMVNDKIDVTR